jgi:hypothetical protein
MHFVDFSSLDYKLLNDDYAFYARLAVNLNEHGVENSDINYFGNSSNGVIPYHYFEIWLTSLIKRFTSVHSQYALILVSFPLLYSIIYFGAVDLVKTIKDKSNIKDLWNENLLAVLLLFVGFFKFLYPTQIDFLAMDVWVAKLVELNKFATIYLFSILIIKGILNRNNFLIGISASFMAIAYVSISPALFSAVGLYFLYLVIIKENSVKQFIINLLPLLATTVFFYLFYSFLGERSAIVLDNKSMISQVFELSYLKTFVNVIGKMGIQILIVSFPFVVLIFATRKKIFTDVWRGLLFLLIVLLSSLATWAFLWRMHDSVQLYSNIAIPISNTVLFVLVINLLFSDLGKKTKNAILIMIVLGGSIDLYSKYSENTDHYQDEFFFEKKELLGEDKTFAFFKEEHEYKNRFNVVEKVYVGQLRNLGILYDPLKSICLSIENIPAEEGVEENFVKMMTFYQYLDSLKIKQPEIEIVEAQISFLEKYKIDYLLFSNKRGLPREFENYYYSTAVTTIDNYNAYKRIDDAHVK